MIELGSKLFAWFATAWLWGLGFFALAWIAERIGLLRDAAWRRAAWSAVLIAPLAAAAVHVFVIGGALIGEDAVVTPPVAAAVAPARAVQTHAVAAVTAPRSTPRIAVSASASVAPRWNDIVREFPAWLGFAWLLAAGLGALGVAVQLDRLAVYRRRLTAVTDARVLAIAESLRQRAGLKRLDLCEDAELSSPQAMFGATVVIPAWMIDTLDDAQLAAMLAHEIHHLRRADPLKRALTRVVATVLIPFGAVARGRLEVLAEDACDAWSADQSGSGAPLAQCILACVERGAADRGAGLAVAMADKRSPLVERMRRLMAGDLQGGREGGLAPRAGLALALGVAAFALPGLAVGHAAPKPPAAPAHPVAPVVSTTPAVPPRAGMPHLVLASFAGQADTAAPAMTAGAATPATAPVAAESATSATTADEVAPPAPPEPPAPPAPPPPAPPAPPAPPPPPGMHDLPAPPAPPPPPPPPPLMAPPPPPPPPAPPPPPPAREHDL